MSGARARWRLFAALASLAWCLAAGCACAVAGAQGLADDGGASWRLEQPQPPPPPPGVEGSSTPIGLGRIGDIKFWAPNRGLLITAGNGSTIPPGVWTYDGRSWHELATVCGASDGRIAWEGPDEFWTVSDGRPGQAAVNGKQPPLEDDTLCHFEKAASERGEVAGSYASLAFQANSYQPMHAAACISVNDCWFGGELLPEPQIGAFQLHWDGSSLSEQSYPSEGYVLEDAAAFEGHIYEAGRVFAQTAQEPPTLLQVNPNGVSPTFELVSGLPLYAPGEFPTALEALHLSAAEGSLWAGAGPVRETPSGSLPGQVTLARYTEGAWSELLGPNSSPSGGELFPGDVVTGVAAEPGTGAAWLALDTQQDVEKPNPNASAIVARVGADGAISSEDELRLPAGETSGPKGGSAKIACPAPHDCWLATTQGWLYHLTTGSEELPQNGDPAFAGPITYRPPDAGVPQVGPDAPPADDSGLLGELPRREGALQESEPAPEERVRVPLLSHLHSRLLHGTELELRFQLAVKARLRLLARRHKQLVASTPMRTFAPGRRKLLLRLNRHRWPTRLQLQTHALAPLPTEPAAPPAPAGFPHPPATNAETVSTSLTRLPNIIALLGSEH